MDEENTCQISNQMMMLLTLLIEFVPTDGTPETPTSCRIVPKETTYIPHRRDRNCRADAGEMRWHPKKMRRSCRYIRSRFAASNCLPQQILLDVTVPIKIL